MSCSYTNWLDRWGDQVSKIRERNTGEVTLTMPSYVDGIEDALSACFFERITPKVAAERYLRWIGEIR
jgi:hypothetical protein